MRLDPAVAADLVRHAAGGDRRAWDALVDEYGGLIWAITRSYRLSAPEAADVSQTTWLRLCENIDRLRDPGAVGAWLATTARRECLNQQSRGRAVDLVEDMNRLEADVVCDDPVDARLLQREREAAVRAALVRLPARPQQLLRMLMTDDPPSYEDVAAALDLPIGSIGPTRGRALRRLRQILESSEEEAASVTG
jgi:RNA polymerase sigma factor (sigma-70 family)